MECCLYLKRICLELSKVLVTTSTEKKTASECGQFGMGKSILLIIFPLVYILVLVSISYRSPLHAIRVSSLRVHLSYIGLRVHPHN